MEIKIGGEELAYWVRKNKRLADLDNRALGRRIGGVVTSLGGTTDNVETPSLWPYTESLPMSTLQYTLDVEKLPELYRTLDGWR